MRTPHRRLPSLRALGGLLGAGVVIAGLAGTAASQASAATDTSTTPSVAVPAGGVFGPSSVWRTDISAAPTASNSAAQVAKVVEQVNAYNKGQAAFNIYSYGLSWYTVSEASVPGVGMAEAGSGTLASCPSGPKSLVGKTFLCWQLV